jgi:glutaryl-CoA dehydrogenase (non-decarboxylating)
MILSVVHAYARSRFVVCCTSGTLFVLPGFAKGDGNTKHKMIEKMAYDFARKEVMPIIKEHDRNHTYPHELLPKMAALGFLGVCLPVRYGGAGWTTSRWASSPRRWNIGRLLGARDDRRAPGPARAAHLPVGHGGAEARFLPPLARGEHIACFGLTEPGAGSDVAAMRTTARKDGDDYILNGEKMWITLSNVADRFLVFAKTDTSKGAGGISAFILERGWPGLTTGTIEGKMGVHASNTGWIAMHDVRVPKTHRLGLEGEGFKIAMSALDNARYGVAAGAVGVMKACLDESIKYAKQRQTFGRPSPSTSWCSRCSPTCSRASTPASCWCGRRAG